MIKKIHHIVFVYSWLEFMVIWVISIQKGANTRSMSKNINYFKKHFFFQQKRLM